MVDPLTPNNRKAQLQSNLHRSISVLSKSMQKRIEVALAVHSITHLQWLVLSGIGIEEHHSPSALACHIGISRPALSRLIKNLISNNLVKRDFEETDGRGRNIQITELGREKIELCWPLISAHQAFYVNKLSEIQLHEFEQSLELLSDVH